MKTTIETDITTDTKIPKPTHVTLFEIQDPEGEANCLTIGKADIDLAKYCHELTRVDHKLQLEGAPADTFIEFSVKSTPVERYSSRSRRGTQLPGTVRNSESTDPMAEMFGPGGPLNRDGQRNSLMPSQNAHNSRRGTTMTKEVPKETKGRSNNALLEVKKKIKADL